MRGRKKKENSLTESFTIKITKEQKIFLDKNKELKKDLIKYVRQYLKAFE